ncbi:DUF1285 domain-containing protein [Parvularcula maris]|uniref:DUF1285 domain-containing protein n=1 Tax=Parvularcula maris TaxID=2965077 RepID=A0A9X2L9X3_9PROT|nr:DUF1285 domain-containing protein [Parvularcula maris]MCQ8185623.1 DUF1285 domain-containing protein [Parvularcula maris]
MDLSRLAASLSDQPDDAPLPVENWRPQHCGEMDLVIRSDGSWWHEGTRISRPALVRLFSRVLRRDDDGYVLVTPVEKIAITVEDVPFLAVDMDETEEGYRFRTNVGDMVVIGPDHPIELRDVPESPSRAPYIRVRGKLDARLDRAVYYRFLDMLPEEDGALVVRSGGATFTLPIEEAR